MALLLLCQAHREFEGPATRRAIAGTASAKTTAATIAATSQAGAIPGQGIASHLRIRGFPKHSACASIAVWAADWYMKLSASSDTAAGGKRFARQTSSCPWRTHLKRDGVTSRGAESGETPDERAGGREGTKIVDNMERSWAEGDKGPGRTMDCSFYMTSHSVPTD